MRSAAPPQAGLNRPAGFNPRVAAWFDPRVAAGFAARLASATHGVAFAAVRGLFIAVFIAGRYASVAMRGPFSA